MELDTIRSNEPSIAMNGKSLPQAASVTFMIEDKNASAGHSPSKGEEATPSNRISSTVLSSPSIRTWMSTGSYVRQQGSHQDNGQHVIMSNHDYIDTLQWLKECSDWENETIHGTNECGATALHIACGNGAPLEVVEVLLNELDKDTIHAKERNFENTALHDACWFEAPVEIVKMLLNHFDKKIVNAANNYGQTALHLACMKGVQAEFLHLLVTHKYGKMLPSARNAAGRLPFDIISLDAAERERPLSNLFHFHTLMLKNDPTGASYPPGLFTSIVKLPSDDRCRFVNHPYLRTALNTEIVKPSALFILFLDVAVQLAVMIVFSFTVHGEERKIPIPSFIVLAICLLGTLSREIVQIFSSQMKSYFGDTSNFIDIVQIGLILSVFADCVEEGRISEYHLVACIAVSWTRLLFVTANLNCNVAVFLDAFIAVTKKIIPFAYVVSMICFAFVHMYEVFIETPKDVTCDEGEEGGEWRCNGRALRASYFHVFAMVLSDEWLFLDKIIGPLSFLSMAFALLVGLVLMNMLIALISNKYTEVEQQSQTAFWVHRLLYIDELHSMFIEMARWQSYFSWIFVKHIQVDDDFDENVEKGGKDEDWHDNTKEVLLPDRMDMSEYHFKRIQEWKSVEKYEKITNWFWVLDSADPRPYFFTRISTFLVMARWSDILFVTIGFKKFFLGVKYGDNVSMTLQKHIVAWMGCSVILFFVYVKAVVMTPLGVLSGGYFWAKELKEYIFFGNIKEKSKFSDDSNMMMIGNNMEGKINQLFEKQIEIEKQNNELKACLDEMNRQNVELKAQISKILEVVSDKKK